MKKILLLSIALFSWAYSASAAANWQYTHWGMTVEQVKAASENKAQPIPGDQAVTNPKFPSLKAPYTSGQYRFNAFFGFDQSKGTLNSVTLRLYNPDQAGELMGWIKTQYGAPACHGHGGNRIGWAYWLSGDDVISIISSTGAGGLSVTIVYEPRNTAPSSCQHSD